eukprot:4700354-Ditylum_brightwellii.AAC.1
MASSRVFLSTPVSSGIQKITNIDEVMCNEGYDTDGNMNPFYDSVEHEEDLTHNIEEEALPSKEELEALMACTENPGPGSFVLISDEDNYQMKVRELQDELKKQ